MISQQAATMAPRLLRIIHTEMVRPGGLARVCGSFAYAVALGNCVPLALLYALHARGLDPDVTTVSQIRANIATYMRWNPAVFADIGPVNPDAVENLGYHLGVEEILAASLIWGLDIFVCAIAERFVSRVREYLWGTEPNSARLEAIANVSHPSSSPLLLLFYGNHYGVGSQG